MRFYEAGIDALLFASCFAVILIKNLLIIFKFLEVININRNVRRGMEGDLRTSDHFS